MLVPSEDAKALEAAFERLIEDRELRRRLGAEARATIHRDFNWATIAEAYERVFETVLGQGTKPVRDGAQADSSGARVPEPADSTDETTLENVSEQARRFR